MFISHNGVLYDEDNFGGEKLGKLRTVVTTKCSLTVSKDSTLENLEVDVATNCTLSFASTVSLKGLTCTVTTEARVKPFVLRSTPGTSKLSSYTILPEISNHTEIANDNLPTQFKDCPNINDLMSFSLDELDQAQTDVYDFQSKILNIEEAEGVNLDLCGAIVGRDRITDDTDYAYRPKILTQVYINNNNTSLPNLLTAFLVMFNLEPDYTSYNELQLKRTSFNSMEVFVRDKTVIDTYSTSEEIEGMMAAGSRVEICVLDRTSEIERVFRLSGYENQPDDEASTIKKGFGSYYDDTVGGNCTGLYNYGIYYRVSGENANAGSDMLTTTKTIPVETF